MFRILLKMMMNAINHKVSTKEPNNTEHKKLIVAARKGNTKANGRYSESIVTASKNV
jgi:hypothetical protein